MGFIDGDVLYRSIKNSNDLLPHERIAFMKMVREQFVIDAVPVVRCRECESFQVDEIAAPGTGTCWHCEMVRRFDDFCSYGKRKDGEG